MYSIKNIQAANTVCNKSSVHGQINEFAESKRHFMLYIFFCKCGDPKYMQYLTYTSLS